MEVIRGRVVHSVERIDHVDVIEDAIIGYTPENGEIKVFEELNETRSIDDVIERNDFEKSDIMKLKEGQFIMPGLIDTHIHAPQYKFTGTGYDKQLLEWLGSYTFPVEATFKDVSVARTVYPKVVRRCLYHGTTTASYFATIHLDSTIELCKEIASQGQRALVGKVNMDMRSPDILIETIEDSIRDTESFIEYLQQKNNPLVQPVITPRFSPTCSEPLMRQLGEIAAQKDLRIQTHMCEQLSELDYTLNICHPDYEHSAEIFDRHGLLTEKTYLAHCIYCNERELEMMKEKKVGIAHCPSSNLCLRSGILDTRMLLNNNFKIGLGTDVSGGYSPSILDAIRTSVHASKALGFTHTDESYTAINHHEAFYMATMGGARVLGLENEIGNFKVRKQFDALVIDTLSPSSYPVFDVFEGDTFEDIFSKFLYLGDDRNIVKVFVAGKQVKTI